MGHTIQVVYNDKLVHEYNALGKSDYSNFVIELQPDTPVYPIHKTLQGQVFLHEVIHFALHTLREYDQCEDEKFVDNLAGLLYQALFKEDIV